MKRRNGLISACRRDPSETNRAALRKQIAVNYDKVVARKKAKLEELKRTARHASKVQEMQEIVDEMLLNREKRIEQSMRRFTDPRLRPGSRNTDDGYLPVLGAARNVSIARTPVTCADYFEFVKATGRKPPKEWRNGVMPGGRERHPVVNVSYDDAVAYCRWLSAGDGKAVYRLPTEEEWSMPPDICRRMRISTAEKKTERLRLTHIRKPWRPAARSTCGETAGSGLPPRSPFPEIRNTVKPSWR